MQLVNRALRTQARAMPLQRAFAAPRICTRTFAASAARRKVEEDISADRLAELLAETKTNGRPLLVDFVAEWCGPCKMLSPILTKLANNPDMVGGREFDLVTVDVDKQVEVAQIFKFVGVIPEPKIIEFIQSI
ncbi:hypothetical protein MCUN1_001266 [Malassezia cuniculi]|uniref:Thioredoxin domain-containing protein n=1 Tax=Malassezia cuniculi TaxID=948313 RepID=A0AAF0J5U7_9BASI|nr:hypothetical protein MCUN1_001266 [Malassezia cuniculi]